MANKNKIRNLRFYDYDAETDTYKYNRSRASKYNYYHNMRFTESGKFAPKDYAGTLYRRIENGELVRARKSQAKDFARSAIKGDLTEDKTQLDLNNKYLEAITHEQFSTNKTTVIFVRDVKPIEITEYEDENGVKKSTQEKFEYSYVAQSKFGLKEETQYKVWKIFTEANEIITKLKIIEPELGAYFSVNLDSKRSIEQLQRQITAAEKIVGRNSGVFNIETFIDRNEDYFNDRIRLFINKEVSMRKQDLIDAFENLVDDSGVIKNFKSILNVIDPKDLLDILRKFGRESFAYALDSIIKAYGYEMIFNEVKFLTARLNERMKERVAQFEKEQKK